jgi:hypothetical protein
MVVLWKETRDLLSKIKQIDQMCLMGTSERIVSLTVFARGNVVIRQGVKLTKPLCRTCRADVSVSLRSMTVPASFISKK